jgi:MscS family membrane protein
MSEFIWRHSTMALRTALASIPLCLAMTLNSQARPIEAGADPLAPADTSSPRATLKSFRENMDDAFRAYLEAEDAPLPPRGGAEKRAVDCLDTSELSPVRARRLASEAALILNDVLDRIELPPYEEIPDAARMAELPPDAPKTWRIPGTDIEIARVMDGPRTGAYLFTPRTVARARELYALARNMPYQPGAMNGLYERIVDAPGPWIPTKWIRALPQWAKADLRGQAGWKWIAMGLTTAVWLLMVYLAHRFTGPKDGAPRHGLRFVVAVALLPVTVVFRSFFQSQLLITGAAYEIVDNVVVVLYYLIGSVAVLNLGATVAATITSAPRFEKQGFDTHLASVACHAVAWLVVLFLIARAASNIGVPVEAVITSLGVGGIAFALAARPTLENLIAGMTMYLDKPVKIGQFCQFEDVLGTVERIGLRSTRIRRWGGQLLSIPNAQFAEHQLDNYNDARNIWIRQKLRVRYETSPEQLSYLLAKIREMLFAHPKIIFPRVRLVGFGDDSLTVDIVCYTDTGIWAEWHAIREDVLLRTMDIIEACGTRVALPSKTVYFTRDDGLDEERREAAEQSVRQWSEAGELPFPDMSDEQRERLAGTLQFPPEGSVEHEAETKQD